MIGKVRLIGVATAVASLMLLGGCGDKKNDKGATGKIAAPVLSADLTIKVDESSKTFKINKNKAKTGTVKLTVDNPSTNKGQHGIGIDGGVYKDIDGAAVKPGRKTSLTVDLKPGNYEIYDSYKNNRAKGYTTKIKVE